MGSNGLLASLITSGLVAYWKLDETSTTAGATVGDSSGNGNTGTPNGAGGSQNLPQPNITIPSVNFTNPRSLNFDGTDDYVSTPGTPFGFGTTDFSVAFWVKTTTTDRRVLGNYSAGAGWGLYIDIGKLDWFIYGTGGGNRPGAITVPVTNGNWHHVISVVTRSGTSLTNRLYFDGTNVGTTTSTVGDITSATPLYLGTHGTLDLLFAGSLDDVRIYNRALSASEITTIAAGNG